MAFPWQRVGNRERLGQWRRGLSLSQRPGLLREKAMEHLPTAVYSVPPVHLDSQQKIMAKILSKCCLVSLTHNSAVIDSHSFGRVYPMIPRITSR